MMFDWGGGRIAAERVGPVRSRGDSGLLISKTSRFGLPDRRVSTAPLTTPLQVKPYSGLALE